MSKRKRTDLTLKQKLEVISVCDGPPKQTFVAVAKQFNIDSSTVSKIYKNKSKLLNNENLNQNRKRQRFSKVGDVDDALHKWFADAINTKLNVSGEMLRVKAENIARDFNVEDFVATNGWLDRWKKRYGIIGKKVHGDADVSAATEWLSSTFAEVLKRYQPKDVYNADETGLLWRATPNTSYEQTPTISKERISILFCVNMDGDKEQVLVIGNSESSQCFQDVKQLPVNYKNNNYAWMTNSIFKEWLLQWNNKLSFQKRKIVLLVDTCAAHPILELTNIELIFLPSNLTLIQPCNQGIIRNFKFHYRRLLVLKLLTEIESSTSQTPATQIIKKINLLNALLLVKEAWDKVTSLTIKNAFKIFCNTLEVKVSDEETLNLNEIGFDFEKYLQIDDTIECLEPLNQQIIEPKIENEISDVQNDDSDTDDETDFNTSNITNNVALESLRNIQIFLTNHNVEAWDCLIEMQNKINRAILENSTTKYQGTLDKWFE